LSTNYCKFFEGWDVSLATNHFDFGDDLDRDPDTGIFSGMFTIVE